MNSIIFACALLVACHLTQAKTKTDISALLIYASQNSNCHVQGLQCKDCESIQFCSGSLQTLFAIRCADQNPLTPYCDSTSNTCTEALPAVCDIGDSSFICPGSGSYPDALDCTKYYTCDENKLAYKQECPADTIYDHTTQSCHEGAKCLSYSAIDGLCNGIVNKYIPYELSKDLYVLCLYGRDPAIFECPKRETFSESDESCKFECSTNGFFPHAKDPTKFYSCINVGGKILQNKLECLYGTEFIETGEGKGVCSIRTTSTSTTTETILEITTQTKEITTEANTYVEVKTEEINNDDAIKLHEQSTILDSDVASITESNKALITEGPTRTNEDQTETPSETSNDIIKLDDQSTILESDNALITESNIALITEGPTRTNEDSAETLSETASTNPVAPQIANEETHTSNVDTQTSNEENITNEYEIEYKGNIDISTNESAESQTSIAENDDQLENQQHNENESIEHSNETNLDENLHGNGAVEGSGVTSEEILEGKHDGEIAKEMVDDITDEVQAVNDDANVIHNVDYDIQPRSEELFIALHHESEYEEEILENYL